jgi:cephalosporin hydroxylase
MDESFENEVADNVRRVIQDHSLKLQSRQWLASASKYGYTYNFKWLGTTVVQLPADLICVQEIIWDYKPDLIVETGIARAGSASFYTSLLALLELNGHVQNARYVGIDVEIREHARVALSKEPILRKYATAIEGSSIDPEVVKAVSIVASEHSRVIVVLDSSHTHSHVYSELRAYAALVPKGGYIVVFDTSIEWDSEAKWGNRPWGPGDSPSTALDLFLKEYPNFVRDRELSDKGLISVIEGGVIRRTA